MKPTALLLLLAGACLSCGTTYEFDPLTLGGDGSSRTPVAASNAQFVRAIYADLLGRAPEVFDFTLADSQGQPTLVFPIDEASMLLDALDANGDPDALRAVIVAGLVRSSEVTLPEKEDVADPAAFIADRFRRLLGRDPGAYELDVLLVAWQEDPAVGPRTVVRALVGSREYQGR